MNIVTVQELKPYSFDEIKSWFNVEEDQLKEILDSLVLLNIFKKLNYSQNKMELEDLLDVESLEEIDWSINKNMYVFKYVGIVMVENCCFFVYPKYIIDIDEDKKNNFKKFKQILAVIRKYQAKEQIYNKNGFEEIKKFNLLSFTLDLLEDYHKNGVYASNKIFIEENGYGETLWNKTINEQNIYFCDDTPIYLDLYTVTDIKNEENLFTRLHKSIITICSETISEVLEVLEISKTLLSSETIEDIGSKEYLIYKIEQELTQQYITRNQELLYKMLLYIKRDNMKDGQENISFVGTNNFNLVWEDVCACVMGNSLDKTLEELDLKPYGNRKSSDKLIDLIPKPKWKHLESGVEHKASRTLRPDLISVYDGKLSIYDAKYYNIELSKNGVKKQPGIGDITKQYLYELSYQELARKNNLIIDKNAFIMPTDSSEQKSIGIVSIDDLFPTTGEGTVFNNIEVILKPCEDMYEKYLNNYVEK